MEKANCKWLAVWLEFGHSGNKYRNLQALFSTAQYAKQEAVALWPKVSSTVSSRGANGRPSNSLVGYVSDQFSGDSRRCRGVDLTQPPSPGWIRYIAKLANGKLVFHKYFRFLEELVAAV